MYKETMYKEFEKMLKAGDTKEEILKKLPVSQRTYYYWRKKLSYTVPSVPKIREVKEVIKVKKEVFKGVKAQEDFYGEVPVNFNTPKPIGIMFMGDPHIDDSGSDLELFESHLNLAKTNEDIYVIGMGDYLNNWVGYLSKLFSEEHITFEEGADLVKHYFKDVSFLAMILGNHCKWATTQYYFKEIFDDKTVVGEDIRLKLMWDKCEPVTVHIRHSFKGKSQYNPAFPLVKQAVFNHRDDLICMGHMHQTGYQIYPQPGGYLSHCFIVGSYKKYDSFGKSIMTHETNITPAIMAVIDPFKKQNNPDRIKLFFDVFEGVDYLNYLKSKMN